MRLINLTINNFGVFRGRHDFDLTPVLNIGHQRRPLTVISGQNGVGKSTLFQALTLALHGSLALGDQISRQTYNEFMLSRLHRYTSLGIPMISEDAALAVSFQYVQSGHPQRIYVERLWSRNGQNVTESLHVTRDGRPPEVAQEDFQNWLNDLFPPGLASVCFFDAEKLETLSHPEHYSRLLGETLRRLFGLDLVERLQGDLERYTLLQGGGRKESTGKLQAERKELQSVLKKLDTKLEQLSKKNAALETEEQQLAEALTNQERRLAAEGGTYAERRPQLLERLKIVKEQSEELATQLRDMCGELLPFTLAPTLCQRLSQRLAQDTAAKPGQTTDTFWQEHLASLKTLLREDALWQGLAIPPDARKTLAKRLVQKLQRKAKAEAGTAESNLHQLSDPERERLQGWIAQSLQVVPQQVAFLGERLRSLKTEQQQIEADLQRAPAEEALAAFHTEINRLQVELAALRKQRAELSEQLGAVQFQRGDCTRKIERLDEKLSQVRARENQTKLAERSRQVLRAYREALLRQRLATLEKALVEKFNAICRKEHLIESVVINPADFTIELRSLDTRPLDLTGFSAGERQLYALAMLWALRQVSGRQLPLMIDTPLARLDDNHRSRFIHDFAPAVSDQLVLLTTDAEMDFHLLDQAAPHCARVYRLSFDAEREETLVSSSDAQPSTGVDLYRGETPGAIGLDVHGGFGRMWTTDQEHASAYGTVKQAVLPSSAKRLVLRDPIDGEINWAGIEELQRITKTFDIAQTLKGGLQLYDIWQEEWTYLVQQAGYDSIATYNIEGPEEYVINQSRLIPVHNGNGKRPENSDGQTEVQNKLKGKRKSADA